VNDAWATPVEWSAQSGAVFDLTSNALRPEGWTSADAAGLPIFPGLVRYDEVASGHIDHALRFTLSRTQRAYLHPATHWASSYTDANYSPMGLRFRLRADFDVSSYTGQALAPILTGNAMRALNGKPRRKKIENRQSVKGSAWQW